MQIVQFSEELIRQAKLYEKFKYPKYVVRLVLMFGAGAAGWFVFKSWWGVPILFFLTVFIINTYNWINEKRIMKGRVASAMLYETGKIKEAEKIMVLCALQAARSFGRGPFLNGILTDLSTLYRSQGMDQAAQSVSILLRDVY